MNPKIANSRLWSERYEVLRQHALNAGVLPGARPFGLILVIRHGLAEWMRRWRESLDPAPEFSAPAIEGRNRLPAPDWQSQLIVVMAQMAIPHLQRSYCS